MRLIKELIHTVKELLKAHECLLQLMERKKQVLIEGNIEHLEKIVNREIQFIREIEKLEQERIRRGQQIADTYGLTVEELTASRLASLVQDSEQTATINLLTERFAQVLAKLKAANELNGQLIQQSLDLVQRSIDLMTCLPDTGMYTDKGDSGKSVEQRRFFDLQA